MMLLEPIQVWREPGKKRPVVPHDEIVINKVSKWILANGGCQQPSGRPGEYVIETKLGTLYVHPMDDWVACRFQGDLTLAKEHFGVRSLGQHLSDNSRLNPHSGKWNWHCHDVMPHGWKKRAGVASREALTKLAIRVIAEITAILPTYPKKA